MKSSGGGVASLTQCNKDIVIDGSPLPAEVTTQCARARYPGTGARVCAGGRHTAAPRAGDGNRRNWFRLCSQLW